MSYKTVEFEIEGVAPLLMHNGQLADPMNKFAKAMKKVSSKKKKTDEDYEELARHEFMGGLYVNEQGHPCIPGEVLEATIASGAKHTKKGKVAKSAIIVDGNFPVIYEGPKTPEKLFEDDNFRHVCGVKVGQARVMRTRPKFNAWGVKFVVHYLPDVVDEREIATFVEDAGRVSGLCDGRPRFGRFNVVKTSAAA
jgi:hypothetical protein